MPHANGGCDLQGWRMSPWAVDARLQAAPKFGTAHPPDINSCWYGLSGQGKRTKRPVSGVPGQTSQEDCLRERRPLVVEVIACQLPGDSLSPSNPLMAPVPLEMTHLGLPFSSQGKPRQHIQNLGSSLRRHSYGYRRPAVMGCRH